MSEVGAQSVLTQSEDYRALRGLALDPLGQPIVMLEVLPPGPVAARVDAMSGEIDVIAQGDEILDSGTATALAVDGNRVLIPFFVSLDENQPIIQLDLGTGDTELVVADAVPFDVQTVTGIEVVPELVPEPASALGGGAVLVGLLLVRRMPRIERNP